MRAKEKKEVGRCAFFLLLTQEQQYFKEAGYFKEALKFRH